MPSTPKRIVLLEDDPLQAEWIAEEVLWRSFPDAELRYFESEYSFLEDAKSGNLSSWNPQYAFFDLLIRYYSPIDLEKLGTKPNFSNLPDPKQAGIRCLKHMEVVCSTVRSAIITVLDIAEIEKMLPRVRIIQKGNDELAEQLIQFLKS